MSSASNAFLDSYAKDTITDWGKQDVILVVPPFASAISPLLGPSLLLDDCLRTKLNCRIFYANLVFAAMIGPDLYERLSDRDDLFETVSNTANHFDNDAIFARYAFDLPKEPLLRSVRDQQTVDPSTRNSGPHISLEEFALIDGLVSRFLGYVVDCICKAKPSIVGFSALGKQITSSLAIARLLKAIDPGVVTIMGGNCVTRPMGDALIDVAPMLDYSFSGEADWEFPRFCDDFFRNGSLPASKMIDCTPIENMDSANIPNFEDFFQQIRPLQAEMLLPQRWPGRLPFESSRGCWWGEKRSCAFCGLNTTNIRSRQKSRGRIVSEIAYLTEKYGVDSIAAYDSVMPKEFEGVLAELVETDEHLTIGYQIRANINTSLLDLFAKAGRNAFSAGIESLSTNLLKKMGKGVTALQNLKLLREARSRRIYLWWNVLVGVPGEGKEDYEPILDILPSIEHFPPPRGVLRICIDRYSRYFSDPTRFGITNVRPLPTYRLVYPPNANLEDLAYTFEADFESILSKDLDVYKRLRSQCRQWKRSWEVTEDRPALYAAETTDGWRIVKDTRKIARETFTPLDREAYELLGILNEPTRTTSVPERLRPYLSELLDRQFAIHYEDHYISLVTDPTLGVRPRRPREPESLSESGAGPNESGSWTAGLRA